MKKTMFWTAVAFFLFSAFAGSSNALDITVDTVWPAGTYTPSGNLNIINNATLTILPGAIVKMGPNAIILTSGGGTLLATGVLFTWANEGQQWRAIAFNSTGMSGSRL